MLTAAFRAFGGEDLVRDFLTGLPGGFWGQFFIVMAVIFLLGFFLDFIEIAVVVVPIVAPILLADPSANITAVWLGVMIGLNIQTSFLTPPFGFALFYLRGVAPAVIKTIAIYKGVVAFILLQLNALVIVAAYPKLVTKLPTRISLTSETAPPPLNPRLQFCLEENLFNEYQAREAELRAAINNVRQLDMSYLPDDLQKSATQALDKAENTFKLLADIRTADAAVQAATDEYRPLHNDVRFIQREIKDLETEMERRRLQSQRLNPKSPTLEATRASLEQRIAAAQSEIEALQTQIPPSWEETNKVFQDLEKTDESARQVYRRNVDDAYTPIRELVNIIASTDALAALQPRLVELGAQVAGAEPAAGVDPVAEMISAVRAVDGTKDITAALNDARRDLRNKTPDKEKALQSLDQASTLLEQQLAWRQQAKAGLLPGLQSYEELIRNNIGLRQQSQLPREKALEIVSCTAAHRDIALHF
jgi:predicted  nucleic acid-binding Zn-ribbon protein